MNMVSPSRTRGAGFTLIEILLAVAIFAVVIAAMQTVFHSALRLQTRTTRAVEEGMPLQQTLAVMKRDLANLVVPGGTLSGALQTTPTNATVTPAGASGPQFYTATGRLDDVQPWGEVQKVMYYLAPPTNRVRGLDLYRSVTRNLLPLAQEQFEPEWLMGGVEQLTFWFYDGSQWVATWDSTTAETPLPRAIKVQLDLTPPEDQRFDPTPVFLVVPLIVQAPASTNSTTTTTGGSL